MWLQLLCFSMDRRENWLRPMVETHCLKIYRENIFRGAQSRLMKYWLVSFWRALKQLTVRLCWRAVWKDSISQHTGYYVLFETLTFVWYNYDNYYFVLYPSFAEIIVVKFVECLIESCATKHLYRRLYRLHSGALDYLPVCLSHVLYGVLNWKQTDIEKPKLVWAFPGQLSSCSLIRPKRFD